ncbi:MAG: hypothetical protein QOJ57_2675 [Thermoleophilaceae bacterium]|jgi:hypothetical protein|nr:hypothetical protein [Thermoleophilaceae bacterium]
MARLMPNPLGDLERSLDGLNEELEALRILPEIRDQLVEVNANIRAMCEALAAMQQPQPAP